MKKIIRLGLAFLLISFMAVSLQEFDCVAAVKTINVSKTEASGQQYRTYKKNAPTSQLFSFLKDSPDVIASGTSGTCHWKITADWTLTIDSGQLATGIIPYTINDNNILTYCGGSNWTENGNREKIKKVDIKQDVSLPKNATAVFANLPNAKEITGLENLDTSETTNMTHLFDGCHNLSSLDLSKFNTSNVTDMSYMFYQCNALTSLNVNNFDTSNVANMSYMFCQCNALTSLNVNNFDTSQVENMSYMFYCCYGLTSINVSNFDTSNVTDMRYMFYYCCGLTSINVSNFNTSNVKNMSYMFSVCNHLISLNLSNFNTDKVTNMRYMFTSCSALQILDLSSFNTFKASGTMPNFFDFDRELWQLKIGRNFIPDGLYLRSWPWPPTKFPYIFQDDGLRYITIGKEDQDFQWREVGTGSPHNPKGKTFNVYKKSPYPNDGGDAFNLSGIKSLLDKHDSDEPITFVWGHKPYNAFPSLAFTDSSYKNSDNSYTYPYDSINCPQESYPAFDIYGTLQDEDSSKVTLSYWIDDNSTNKQEVTTVDTTSSNGEKNNTKVNWSFAITNSDDLKALATPKEGGHTIHVEAQDNGIDGQRQDVFKTASATFEAPVAENAIVQFNYLDTNKKQLRDSQTVVRGATDKNSNYSAGYVYNVKQYIPKYLWKKDKDNNLQRYSLSNYNDIISDKCDWGHISSYYPSMGNLKSTGAKLREIPLVYDESGTISLQVPKLNFGSYIRQVMPSKCGLKYSVNEQPRLIVKDTTKSYVKYWKLYLSITKFTNIKDPSKSLDGIFFYDQKGLKSDDAGIKIADGLDFNNSNITDYDISTNWYENDGKQVKISDYYRGPWLNLQGQQPAEGTYQATATWTLENTP